MVAQPEVVNKTVGSLTGNLIQGGNVVVAILNEEAGPPVTLAGLPLQAIFVGRERELSCISRLMERQGSSGTDTDHSVIVTSVSGLGGIGKTALAIRAARMSVDSGDFPGGCLLIDLHGYDRGQEVAAGAALDGLLRALGVAGAHIPPELDGKQRMWRSLLAKRDELGTRMLIVADNVSSSAQVIPLLPGVTSHRVIVTSRDSLADIVGARLIRLDELPISDAVDLMGQQLQLANHEDDRIAREPESAEAIALLCGCLPLALRIVASWLALDHQQQLSYMVGVLTDELSRLRNLRWDSTLDVRAVFDLSYRRLSREAAHLFRVMAANPGPEISAEAASAAANLGLAQTNDILRDLLKASLIAPTPAGPRRWRMHDLVHLYAKETLHEVGIERESAIDNLLDFYITRTALAEKHLDRSCKNPGGTIFVNRGEAIDWLDVEYPNLVSAVSMAYGENRYEYTLRLVFSLYYYFELRKHWSDWIATHEIALMSADKLGNDGSKANALNSMGVANQGLGQWDKAVEFHRRALTIYRRLGRMDAEARVLNNLGTAYRQLGSWRKAVIRHKQSLRLRQQLADYRGVGTTLNNLGAAYEKQGNYQQAVVHHNRALQVYAEHGTLQDYADARNRLGVAYHGLGRWDEAAECHRESIEIYREHNNKHDEADALNSLALVYQHTGHWEKAIDCHERSLVTYRDHGDFQGTAWALMSLGNTYHAMGRVMDANGNWQNALAIFNGLPGADASARVAELRAKLALLLDN